MTRTTKPKKKTTPEGKEEGQEEEKEAVLLARASFEEAHETLAGFLSDNLHFEKIAAAAHLMSTTIRAGGKLMACGNGGSHCDAAHFAEELSGRFRADRRPLPALSISEGSYLTCVGNDYGFSQVFARFIEGLGKPEDTLLAISSSGNSPNILEAVKAAEKKGMSIVLLTGRDGGKLNAYGNTHDNTHTNVHICVPHQGYADRIQEIHITIIHTLIQLIEKQLGEAG